MSPLKVSLLVGGAFFEFAGIIVLAFPDAAPYWLQFLQWLRNHTSALRNRIRRLLGWRSSKVIEVQGTAEASSSGRASVLLSISANATLEQKVQYLLNREQEAQHNINALRERMEDFETESRGALKRSRREIEAHFAQKLRIALEKYRRLRICGAVALLVGLVCVTFANFID